MSLTLSSSSSNSSSEGYMGDGVYIDECEILSVENVTESEVEQGFSRDVSIKTKLKVLKNDWERIVTIGGNYKRDPQSKEIVDWGGAFRVADLFKACEAPDAMDPHGQPSQDMMDACVGKKLLTLTYTNNKGKYSTWNQVTSVKRSKENFLNYFFKQVRKGYPKNYQAPTKRNPQPQSSTVSDAISSMSSESL